MPLEAGDIAWVELDPVLGTEQAGRRPALVVSGGVYNKASRRAVICPISRSKRDWAFNIQLPSGLRTSGAVMADQIRTVEQSLRIFGVIERAPVEVLDEVRNRLAALLGIEDAASLAPPG